MSIVRRIYNMAMELSMTDNGGIRTGIAAILCLYGAIVCLLAASDENQLPDIEDMSKLQNKRAKLKRRKNSLCRYYLPPDFNIYL